MNFFIRVKKLVKLQNKTLKSFMEDLSINYETYQSCRRYNNLPRLDDAYKIAQALNTTVEFLLTGNSTNPAEVELKELKKIIKDFSNSL